ncbi:phosphoserine phosphatase RsbU [bacterium BMS3Bbin03]|nr:phosphoserine phosphatase RsbU [bacterium BMS3Bbin03]
MSPEKSGKTDDPKLRKILMNDLHQGNFKQTFHQEFDDAKEFFLTRERKKQLQKMHRIRRWLSLFWWLLKAMFLKLTSFRRILLVIGIIFVLTSGQNNGRSGFVGGILILFVLMLELKDKLLAQSELAEGRAVQRALTPEESPRVPGWDLWLFTQSANEVGGDLVDFLRIEENRMGIALGDVSGKGLGAALLMTKLQATLRALAPDLKSLSELGRKINKIFRRDILPNSFASLIYAELKPHSKDIRLLNAGHLPPIILRGSAIEELPKGGLALGLSSDAAYTEHRVKLELRDTLLVYSDGLTEAMNEKRELFGEERLFTLLAQNIGLPAKPLGLKLLTAVQEFIGKAKRTDDLSLVIMRPIEENG